MIRGLWRTGGIHIRHWKSPDTDTKRLARHYFRCSVFPVLTPVVVNFGHPFPFLSNQSLSLAVEARDSETKERKFARLKVPEILPRFEILDPNRGAAAAGAANNLNEFLPIEQLIAANLGARLGLLYGVATRGLAHEMGTTGHRACPLCAS